MKNQIRNDLDNGNRICNRCGQEKVLDNFSKDKKCLLGRSRTCKQCSYEQRDLRNKGKEEEVRAYKEKWYQKNKGKLSDNYHKTKQLKDWSTKTCTDCCETKSSDNFVHHRKLCIKCYNMQQAVWRQQNLDRAKLRDKNYRQNLDPQERYWAMKEWRTKNKDYLREWRKANPTKERSYKLKRRALEFSNGRNDLSPEQIEQLQNTITACVYCGSSEDLTIDHIKPISKGGENTFDNVTIACRSCNSRKGNKIHE